MKDWLIRSCLAVVLPLLLLLPAQETLAESSPSLALRDFNIPRGNLCIALELFAKQSGVGLMYPPERCDTAGEACEVSGRTTRKAALKAVLCKVDNVEITWIKNSVAVFIPLPPPPEPPVVTVTASPNADIRRNRYSALSSWQLDPRKIPFSAALSIGDLLTRELTFNVPLPARVGAEEITAGGRSFNLRGLGENRTTVLIDGRRPALIGLGGQPRQPDLDLFAPEMIGRVEVLTVPGAGLAGTGESGAINVIRKREGEGTRLTASAGKYAGISGGPQRLAFEKWGWFGNSGGAYSVQASLLDEDAISASDRSGLAKGKRSAWQHNSEMIERGPPAGATTNVRSEDGRNPLASCGAPLLAMSSTWRPGAPVSELCANAGDYSLDLSDDARVLGGALATVRAAHRATSVDASMSLPLNSWLVASADLAYAHSVRKGVVGAADELPRTVELKADDPDNPFGQSVLVNSPYPLAYGEMTRDHIAASGWVGLTAQLEDIGSLSLEYTNARANARITRPILAGDVATRSTTELLLGLPPASGVRLIMQSTPRFRTKVDEVASRLRIPFGDQPADDGELLVSLQHRRERLADVRLSDARYTTASDLLPEEDPGRRTQVVDSLQGAISKPLFQSYFGEHPLVAELNVRYDRWRLELAPEAQGDRRYDNVSGAGALAWTFAKNWLVRAGYAESYFPPTVMQLVASPAGPADFSGIADPQRPGQMLGQGTLLGGGNPSLRPERVRAYSIGLMFTGSRFDASAQLLRIDRSDLIVSTEELFSGNDLMFLSTRPWLISRTAEGVVVDGRALNIDQQRLDSVDVSFGSHKPLADGIFGVRAAGTWTPTFLQRETPFAEESNVANIGNLAPPRYRALLGLRWDWRTTVSAGLTSRWVGKTEVSRDAWTRANQGGRTVSAQIYHDLFVSYRPKLPGALEEPLEIRLDGRNIFRVSPPFDAGEYGYWSRYGLDEVPAWRITFRYSIGGQRP